MPEKESRKIFDRKIFGGEKGGGIIGGFAARSRRGNTADRPGKSAQTRPRS
jgi:hypothetical protein